MTRISSHPCSIASRKITQAALVALFAAGRVAVHAQPTPQSITVPNFSFESPVVPAVSPFVSTVVDSWQKNPTPSFYGPLQLESGITFDQTTGIFLDTPAATATPYGNKDGNQLGYILAVPTAALFQTLGATFQVGQNYNMTVDVYGDSHVGPAATLDLLIYYVNGSGAQVILGDTTIPYDATVFTPTPPLNLVTESVNTGEIQPGSGPVGQAIGIEIESTVPIQDTTFGNWDIDNVQVTMVPEPGSVNLLALGVGGWLLTRARRRAGASADV